MQQYIVLADENGKPHLYKYEADLSPDTQPTPDFYRFPPQDPSPSEGGQPATSVITSVRRRAIILDE